MKLRQIIGFIMLLLSPLLAQPMVAESGEAQGGVNVKEVVMGHLSDAYEWHITTWGNTHVTLPLPVIVKGEESGWHVFSSARFHDSPDGVSYWRTSPEEVERTLTELGIPHMPPGGAEETETTDTDNN